MADTEKRRLVSKNWYLGETLGKGAYGFVKTGYHIKNNKPFALKFMRRAAKEDSWALEQAKSITNEINALQKVKSNNVVKLFAFNLKCSYPERDGTSFDTFLLVLELAPGGELFDILYYTGHLTEALAQTYFHQLCNGLKAIHDAGICHRDLKPQNLLLDKKYQLKITDFGLAKVFGDDAANKKQKVMKTTCVGTRGYQAPELLLKRKYTEKCDVFSCGVILFILLSGYPPFEEATATDGWYRKICQKKYNKFWEKHNGCHIESDDIKELIQGCIAYQPAERLSVDQMLEHPWVAEPKMDAKQLAKEMAFHHGEARKAKKQDARKMDQLAHSVVSQSRDCPAEVLATIPIIPESTYLYVNHTKMYQLSKEGEDNPKLVMDCVRAAITSMKGTSKNVNDNVWHLNSHVTTSDGAVAYLEFRIFKLTESADTEILAYINVHGDSSPKRKAGTLLLDQIWTDAGWGLGDVKILETDDIDYDDFSPEDFANLEG